MPLNPRRYFTGISVARSVAFQGAGSSAMFRAALFILYALMVAVSGPAAAGSDEEEEPAVESVLLGGPPEYIYTADINIFSPRYVLSNTVEAAISGKNITGRIKYWTQRYLDSSLDKQNTLSLFTCSLDYESWSGVEAGMDLTARENHYRGASELHTTSRRIQGFFATPEQDGFSTAQKLGFNMSDAGEKRQVETGWSGETAIDYAAGAGSSIDFRCGLDHRFERGVVSPFNKTLLSGLAGIDAGTAGRLALDFSMNRLNKTYFVDLFDDWEQRKERSHRIAFSAPDIRLAGSADLTVKCTLSESDVTYLLGSGNNQSTGTGAINFTADLAPVEFASFHFTGDRSLGTAEYAAGDSSEIIQRTVDRSLSGKLHIDISGNIPVVLHQNATLTSILYGENREDEDRDIFHSASGMTVDIENMKLDRCSLVLTSETDMLVYMSGARSSRNYEKNTYRVTGTADYSPFRKYSVSHTASLSATYTQYVFDENRNSAFLLRYLNNTVSRSMDKGDLSLTYRYETRESGSWVSSVAGGESPVFRSSGLTGVHTARMSVGREPFPGLEFEAGGSARLREVFSAGADAGKESFIDLDFDLEGDWELSRGGTISFSASKAVRGKMYSRWNLLIKMRIPF